MANPFKKIAHNAETSKNRGYDTSIRKETVTSSQQCINCGAPRPKRTNLASCDYCKTPFMENVQNFKADL